MTIPFFDLTYNYLKYKKAARNETISAAFLLLLIKGYINIIESPSFIVMGLSINEFYHTVKILSIFVFHFVYFIRILYKIYT